MRRLALTSAAFLGVADEVLRDRPEPCAKRALVPRLIDADALGRSDERLVENVIGEDEPLQISGNPPGDAAVSEQRSRTACCGKRPPQPSG